MKMHAWARAAMHAGLARGQLCCGDRLCVAACTGVLYCSPEPAAAEPTTVTAKVRVRTAHCNVVMRLTDEEIAFFKEFGMLMRVLHAAKSHYPTPVIVRYHVLLRAQDI